jgi:DNA-binding response OmpR family regulator
MDAPQGSSILVVVVDPRVADYVDMIESATGNAWTIHFLRNGHDALRAAARVSADLWIINVDLPDIDGLDVVEMLGPYVSPSDIFVIADEYHESDEMRALALGVAVFLCKPLDADWLRQWCPRHSKSLN